MKLQWNKLFARVSKDDIFTVFFRDTQEAYA